MHFSAVLGLLGIGTVVISFVLYFVVYPRLDPITAVSWRYQSQLWWQPVVFLCVWAAALLSLSLSHIFEIRWFATALSAPITWYLFSRASMLGDNRIVGGRTEGEKLRLYTFPIPLPATTFRELQLKFMLETAHQDVVRRRIRTMPRAAQFVGVLSFPKSCYVNDSREAAVRLILRTDGLKLADAVEIVHRKSTGLTFELSLGKDSIVEYLEAEILAAGIAVDGAKRQRVSFSTSEVEEFVWNCHFRNSGVFEITIRFRSIGVSGTTTDVGRLSRQVKVRQIDHLTQRQVQVLGMIAAIITGILAIVEALRRLHVF